MKKLLLCLFLVLVAFFALPLLVVLYAEAGTGMGLFILLFFLVNPVVMAWLGMIGATDWKKLWWVPIGASALFPLLHALALWCVPIWDLYVYSVFYVFIGYLTMFFAKYIRKQKEKTNQ